MTNAELKTRFLIGYEFIANNLAPGYTNGEISGFLNQGMDLLVDELYGKGDIANIAELIEKVSSSLTLYTPGTEPEDYGTYVGWLVPYPLAGIDLTDLRWVINAKAKVVRNEPFGINNEWIACDLIDKKLAEKWVSTAINKPIIVYPKLIWHGTTYGFAVLYDVYSTISELQVMYIRTPDRIDVTDGLTCELNHRLHQKIVDKAVQLAMKATDTQRAQGEIQVNQAI